MVTKLKYIILFGVFLAISNGEQPQVPPEPYHSSTTDKPTTVTPSTTDTPTTSKPTDAPTPKPTTPTVEPTTDAPTTISPSPKPIDPPEVGKWSYTNKTNNETCIVIEIAVQLNVSYINSDNKKTFTLINIPANTTTVTDGNCGNDTQSITLQWSPIKSINTATWTFATVVNSSDYALSEILFNISSDVLADSKENKSVLLYYSGSAFEAPLSNSYHCSRTEKLNLTDSASSKNIVSVFEISHVQIDAFRKETSDKFRAALDCEIIDTPDIVPIAVGCALAALVIIVLIAYLVGRRRSQARGYLSM